MQSHSGDPHVLWEELQQSSAQTGTCEYPHTYPAPLTLGNTEKGESPAPLQEFGSITSAMGRDEYI